MQSAETAPLSFGAELFKPQDSAALVAKTVVVKKVRVHKSRRNCTHEFHQKKYSAILHLQAPRIRFHRLIRFIIHSAPRYHPTPINPHIHLYMSIHPPPQPHTGGGGRRSSFAMFATAARHISPNGNRRSAAAPDNSRRIPAAVSATSAAG